MSANMFAPLAFAVPLVVAAVCAGFFLLFLEFAHETRIEEHETE